VGGGGKKVLKVDEIQMKTVFNSNVRVYNEFGYRQIKCILV
jgi:hypothetical protein